MSKKVLKNKFSNPFSLDERETLKIGSEPRSSSLVIHAII